MPKDKTTGSGASTALSLQRPSIVCCHRSGSRPLLMSSGPFTRFDSGDGSRMTCPIGKQLRELSVVVDADALRHCHRKYRGAVP